MLHLLETTQMVLPDPSQGAPMERGAAAPLERSVMRSLSKTALGFEALFVAFNPQALLYTLYFRAYFILYVLGDFIL